MLDKKSRIRTSKEYNNVFKNGPRAPGRFIIVYFKKNKGDCNRYGFITSKKVGNAIIRNRVKRQLRAIVRQNLKQIKGNYDIVVIARARIGESSFQLLEKDFLSTMKKAGLC